MEKSCIGKLRFGLVGKRNLQANFGTSKVGGSRFGYLMALVIRLEEYFIALAQSSGRQVQANIQSTSTSTCTTVGSKRAVRKCYNF